MDQEIKNRWVENLSNGEYEKANNNLRNENGFCCLGVLTDMYIEEFDGEWEFQPMAHRYVPIINGKAALDSDSLLPREVREWAGIKDEDTMIHNFVKDSLASINDNSDTFEPVIERIKEL